MAKKALITGGSGFLGRSIVNELRRCGYETISFDKGYKASEFDIQGDILDFDALKFSMRDVSLVFHIAGILGTTELVFRINDAIDINIKGTVNVLEAAKQAGVGRVFYPTKPNIWRNTYSITKFAGEEFVKMFDNFGYLEVRILRWLNAYGPQQKLLPVRKAVPMMIIEAIEGIPLTIWGTGDQPVDLIHASDLARITVGHTLNEHAGPEVFDTGMSERISVNQLADLIIKLTGSKSEIQRLPMRLGEVEEQLVPHPKSPTASSLLNLTDPITLESGMLETIEFYERLDRGIRRSAIKYYLEQ